MSIMTKQTNELVSNQVISKLIHSEETNQTNNPTIPNSKSTCSSERNLYLLTYPNIISINVGAQRISYIFWS